MSEEKNLSTDVTVEVVTALMQREESLVNGLLQLQEKIMLSACDEVQSWKPEKQEAFLRRTAVMIAKDENLKPCFNSPEGKLSIVNAVHRSVSTGLEIGGVHAYLVPQGRTIDRRTDKGIVKEKVFEARFSIRDRGYHALLCGGKKPIFSDLRWGQVYEKDECSVNSGTGQVKHNVNIGTNSGALIGIWVQCVKMNGQKEARFFNLDKINQWKKQSKALTGPWTQWPDEMALQASIRHFCDRYEQARELLASAIYDDEIKLDPDAPIEERADSILNANLEQPEPVEKEPKDVTETEPVDDEAEKESDPENKGELF